jgi:hypothetical protein
VKDQQAALETVQVGPLSLSAAVGAIEEEGRTFELVFSTGAPVERYDWFSGKRYVEKLSLDPAHVRLDRLNAGAPVLDSHGTWDLSSVIGVIEEGSAKVAGKKGTAKARLSAHDDVARIRQDVRDRVIRNVSVGYRVYRFEEVAGKGDNALPVRTATDWEPFEVSLVPMGADPGARVRGQQGQTETNPCVIVRSLEETVMKDQEKTAAAPAETPASPPPAPATDTKVRLAVELASSEEIEDSAKKVERERAAAIRKLCRGVSGLKEPEKVADDLVARGLTLDQARAEILAKLSAGSQEHEPVPGRVVVGDDVADKRRRGITAALLVRSGAIELLRQAAKRRSDHRAFQDVPADPGEFRHWSMLRMAEEDLERRGQRVRGLEQLELASRVIREVGELQLRGTASVVGAQTTSDFAVALESTLNKVLLAAYVVAPDTWRRFCAVGSLNDFRPHPRYRTGYLGVLDEVNDAGEFKNKNLPDAVKESITGKTKGNILALTRQTLINDDMGIFNRVATQAGRAAALTIEKDVYALLALNGGLGPAMNDTKTLFHADHFNIGAGSALTVAGLDADAVVLALQTDPQGNEILDLLPAILLVARGLQGTARVINEAEFDTDAGAPSQRPNRVRGMFRDIVGTGQMSGTRRYVFADPAQMPVLEVAFLDGVQEPFLDMQDGWRIDGVEWKVRIDYAVGAIEFRGAVTNGGA